MDEFIEILDENALPTGEKCLKSVAHKNGLYHASVHIWLYTKSKEVLIQKRKENKDTFPNLWDISVAGHIAYKEKPLTAALREIEEEIGLCSKENELQYIGTSTHKNIHAEDLIDHELHHIYISELKTDIKDLKIQEEEVAAIKLIPISSLQNELEHNAAKYVPHGMEYYTRVFDEIHKLL